MPGIWPKPLLQMKRATVTCDRRDFLGMMCGAAVIPPKEFLKVFEPKSKEIWAEWCVDAESNHFVELFNRTNKAAQVLIEITTVEGRVGEVMLTVNGKRSIIKPEWKASPII